MDLAIKLVMRYAVVECPVCGRYLAIDSNVGYRKCPYCGYVNGIEVSRVVKTFKSPREASELVKLLNSGSDSFRPLSSNGS